MAISDTGYNKNVALFTRAWIEIANADYKEILTDVALFMRAWIETTLCKQRTFYIGVALFMRAWIETPKKS